MLARRHTPKPEALALTSTEVPQRPNLTNQELDTLRNAFFCLIGTFGTGLYVGMPTNPKEKKAENEANEPPKYSELLHFRATKQMLHGNMDTLEKHIISKCRGGVDNVGKMTPISSPGLLNSDTHLLKRLNIFIRNYYVDKVHNKKDHSVEQDLREIKSTWTDTHSHSVKKYIDDADIYNAFASVPLKKK
jgi:hypothetical protein